MSEQTAQQQENPAFIEFKLKLAKLEEALKAYDPNIGMQIEYIHSQIQTLPELSYILTEEQIGAIIEASARNMRLEINTKAPSPKKAIKSLLNDVTADDF